MHPKRLIFIYAVLLAAAVCLIVLLIYIAKRGGSSALRDYREIIADGEINIATDYNAVGYYVSGDSIVGVQYDLIKKLERDWGIGVNIFLENSLEESLAGLQRGKYDVVARSIPINTRLREKFAFTQSINLGKLVLVQRKAKFNDSIQPIRQHLDLAKKTVYVHKASPAILRLQNLAHEIGDTIYIKENGVYEEEQLVMMVAGGDIDFTVANEQVVGKLAGKFPEIDFETDISFTQLESWAVRKDSPVLLDSLNAWFDRNRD